jgi:hypothetical protein
MQVSSKQKYMEFLPKTKKTAKTISVYTKSKYAANPQKVLEFISLCATNIVSQLSAVEGLTEADKMDLSSKFFDDLCIDIIDKSLHYGKKMDISNDLHIQNTQTIEEARKKMIREILVDGRIEVKMIARVSSVYLSKCMEYGVEPDTTIISNLFSK